MTDNTIPEPVRVVRRYDDHVMVITINRPEARNAVNEAVHIAIGRALEDAENDPLIRAIIVTGSGGEAFCAGADLKALSRGERIVPEDAAQRAWGFAGIVEHVVSKPMIAAVNGFAQGGGTEIALACDLIVASENAVFGLPEVKRGLVAGAGGAFRILQHLPRKIAMEYLLTGDPIDAATARNLGLVNQVVPASGLMDAALALAARVVRNAPLSITASKRIALGIVDGKIAADEVTWKLTKAEIAVLMRSEDAREGPRAFAEKRAPNWQGR